jgi:CRP-like cAMP-binding protein
VGVPTGEPRGSGSTPTTDPVVVRFSPTVRSAWSASALGDLPPRAARYLLASATELRMEAGEELVGGGKTEGKEGAGDYCVLVAAGLMRVYARRLNRQVTLRYVSPGFTLGIATVFVGTGSYAAQAVADSRVLRLRSNLLRALAAEDPRVGAVLCNLLAQCLHETSEVVCSNVFSPLRERVARHLLELADRDPVGRLTVRAGAQDIADATGTVRAVVTRVIRQMREEGLVDREGRLYVLLDPSAMHLVAAGGEPNDL